MSERPPQRQLWGPLGDLGRGSDLGELDDRLADAGRILHVAVGLHHGAPPEVLGSGELLSSMIRAVPDRSHSSADERAVDRVMLHARCVDIGEIRHALIEVFDQAIVFHGFKDYTRDYEVIVYATADPRTGIAPKHLRYTFKHCVRSTVTSAVPPEIWARSLDERLIDFESGVELDGYAWGVKWQELYPGMQLVASSVEAARWAHALNLPFHEVFIETNGHNINLVFSDLSVEPVLPGYTPFAVPESGPD